jgi:hypothetical protein
MVQVSVTASVKVEGGPALPLSTTIETLAYTFATVDLTAAEGGNDDQKVDLLPGGGTVTLLGVSARTASGKPATVSLTPSNADKSGGKITVVGTLLVANAGLLAALVAGGPRSVTLENAGTEAVTVDVLTALDEP